MQSVFSLNKRNCSFQGCNCQNLSWLSVPLKEETPGTVPTSNPGPSSLEKFKGAMMAAAAHIHCPYIVPLLQETSGHLRWILAPSPPAKAEAARGPQPTKEIKAATTGPFDSKLFSLTLSSLHTE